MSPAPIAIVVTRGRNNALRLNSTPAVDNGAGGAESMDIEMDSVLVVRSTVMMRFASIGLNATRQP